MEDGSDGGERRRLSVTDRRADATPWPLTSRRAASWARTGRATALAIAGGICGLGAIGCFSIAAVLALVLNT